MRGPDMSAHLFSSARQTNEEQPTVKIRNRTGGPATRSFLLQTLNSTQTIVSRNGALISPTASGSAHCFFGSGGGGGGLEQREFMRTIADAGGRSSARKIRDFKEFCLGKERGEEVEEENESDVT